MKKEREGIVFGLLTEKEKQHLSDNRYSLQRYVYGQWVDGLFDVDLMSPDNAYRVKPESEKPKALSVPAFPEGFELEEIDYVGASILRDGYITTIAHCVHYPDFAGYGYEIPNPGDFGKVVQICASPVMYQDAIGILIESWRPGREVKRPKYVVFKK